MKTILIILIGVITFSCSEFEPTVYNGNFSNEKTFLKFEKNTYKFPIELNSTGELGLKLSSSSVSSSDRTYGIEIDTEKTTANSVNYTFPSTFTIPAGSNFGDLTIQGIDDDNLNTPIETIVFSITGFSNTESFSTPVTINIYEGCPLQNNLTLEINFDGYGNESSWELRDSSNQIVFSAAEGTYSQGQEFAEEEICIEDGDYTFTFFDAYGDGLFDGNVTGNYTLKKGDTVYASGEGNFGSSNTTNFTKN